MTPQELKAFAEKSLSIDCPRITLRQNYPDSPQVHQGMGSVTQTPEGQIVLKLYCPDKVHPKEALMIPTSKAGEIIPKTDYFSLDAVDFHGRQWTATDILPSRKSGFGGEGAVIYADLRGLSQESETKNPAKKAFMIIRFPGNTEIPCNTVTESKTYVGNKIRERSGKLNAARFSACNYEFEIRNEEDWLTVKVLSDSKKMTDFLELRVCEALQFVLARSLSWSVLEIFEANKIITRIRSLPLGDNKSRAQPPIGYKRIDETGSVWKLYEKYLHHILSYSEKYWHPVSGFVHSVIEAMSGSLEAQALTLGVAVEGILRTEFADLALPSEEFKNDIGEAKKLISKSSLEDSVKKRGIGAFDAMLQPRAEDRLKELVKKGLIEKELVEAWKKIRHRSAHADIMNSIDTKTFLKLCSKVSILFNQLIFLAIGYTGKYTDYGTYGWPLKDFSQKKTTF